MVAASPAGGEEERAEVTRSEVEEDRGSAASKADGCGERRLLERFVREE